MMSLTQITDVTVDSNATSQTSQNNPFLNITSQGWPY